MTRSFPATRGRPISITELTKPCSHIPQASRGATSGRPIGSSRPEKDFRHTRTLPALRREWLSRQCLERARERRRDLERRKVKRWGSSQRSWNAATEVLSR